MTPLEAIEILKSQPTVVLAENACRNAEDDEPAAVVVIEISQRDQIVELLQSLGDNRTGSVIPTVRSWA